MSKTSKNPDAHRRRFQLPTTVKRRTKLGMSVLLTILVLHFLLFNVLRPLAQGDGLHKYTGVQREAALRAIDAATYLIDDKSRWAYKTYVKDIYPTPEGTCSPGNALATENPDDPRYYTVVVEVKNLLAYGQARTELHPGCNKYAM